MDILHIYRVFSVPQKNQSFITTHFTNICGFISIPYVPHIAGFRKIGIVQCILISWFICFITHV